MSITMTWGWSSSATRTTSPSVGRFTGDFHVFLPLENKAQSLAHNSVVVCNHNPGLRHMASSTDDGISQRKEVP
jgi:hypothetical protein